MQDRAGTPLADPLAASMQDRKRRICKRLFVGRPMLKRGTFCYVVTSCRASPVARRAVGRIVEVLTGPYGRGQGHTVATCYDVGYQGLVFYCQADKLRPINDPDIDIGEPHDGMLAG
jgi:hypothetical protein